MSVSARVPIIYWYNVFSVVCSATGTAVLLDHEQQEVDRILGDVSVCL